MKLIAKKLDNPEEMDTFIETHKLLTLNNKKQKI